MTKTEVESKKMDTSEKKQDTGTQTTSTSDTGKTEESSTIVQDDSAAKKVCKKHSKKHKGKKHTKLKKGRRNKHRKTESSDSDSSSEDSPSDSDSDSEETESESSADESESTEPDAKPRRRKRSSTLRKKTKRKSHAKHGSSSEDESSESTGSSSDERHAKRSGKAKLPARSRKARRARRKSHHTPENSEDSSSERDSKTVKIKALKAENKLLRAARKSKSTSKKKNKKSQPMKARCKRVDYLWDEETHRFKLQDTVDDSDELAYDKYVFTIRRCFDWEHKYVDTVVDIKSKPLKDALHDVMEGVSGISMKVKEPSVDPNMLFLFLEEMRTHVKELKKSSKNGKSKKTKVATATKAQHLKLLVKYIDKDYADTKKTLYPLLQTTTISFDLLWALYKPNSIVFSPTYGDTEEPRAFKIEYAYKQCHPTKGQYYLIEGQYLEFDGKLFGKGRLVVEVPAFKGIRKITNLNCYPLKYHEEKSALETRLIERGKAFVSLVGTHFRQYNGMAYVKGKKGVQKLNTNGRVMVDPASFRRINPNYQISSVSPNDSDLIGMVSYSDESDSDSCCCASHSSGGEDDDERGSDRDRRKKKKYRVVYDKETDSHQIVAADLDEDGEVPPPKEVLEDTQTPSGEFSDEDLLIASPVALGFSFHDKTWLELKVSALTPITWNEDAFDSLVLPPQQKSIIRALVESHKFHPAKNVDDVISGKGKGLVAVLHGPPGTGKTLTAEGIAELLRCPLYMVSTGELGTDARTLERELQNILEITQVWGALLLLDEADVFLESRGTFDLHRNAMVGIFLRTLEYFQGIMFLTTNRVHNFDSAFQSRIHLALQYKELDFHARKNVWEVFFKRVRAIKGMDVAEFSDEDIEELARIDLNGRQIKNSTRMAQALSVNRKLPLSMKEIKEVLHVAREFKDYFVGGPGWREAEHAYT